MDEKHWMDLTRQVMTDREPVHVLLEIRDLWMLDSALSLTVRHPGITEFARDWYISISHAIQTPIIGRHPEAKELLALGWRDDKDVPIDYERKKHADAMHREMDKKYLRKTGRK